MSQILIADDDEYVLEVVERALRQRGHAVVLAHNGRQARDLLLRQPPDMAILDVVMPGPSGLDLCRLIRSTPTLAALPVLFLTAREQLADKIIGFEAGADDYLAKPFDLSELALRVAALLRHAHQRGPTDEVHIGEMSLNRASSKVHIKGNLVHLTPVEFELLEHLMSRAGQVISAEELLQGVWGYPPGTGSTSLVRMHVLNVRRKIEPDPQNPTYLRTVPRHGYMIPTVI